MHSLAFLALLPVALAAPTVPSAWAKRSEPAPILTPRGATVIPGKYIVKVKDGVTDAAIEEAVEALPIEASQIYTTGFRGFASEMDSAALEAVQSHADVEFIEQEAIFTINTYVTQTGATWGLGAISHKGVSSTSYVYDDSAGAGTCAYVIDTGIYTSHSEFAGRATFLANYADSSNSDGNGHGTHVAGTIGGTTYGVAKKTSLYAVKVLDSSGSGTTSGVIAGMNYVTSDAQTRSCPNGTVANMSLGGSYSASLNSAAAAMITSGVFLAVAAGNDDDDASDYSPASASSVCTVGATDSSFTRAYYSNYGSVVDIFAPGSSIKSSWIGSTTATNTISGTSMATPHITGLGAYLLTLIGDMTPTALCSYMQSIATTGILSDIPRGTKNYFAFNGNPSA